MSATIEVAGARARFEEGVWTCGDARVADALNTISAIEDVPTSDPHPERTLAEQVATVFGGRLVACDPPDAIEDDLIY